LPDSLGGGVEDFLIAIPARIRSSRLPEKPLKELCGKPLIVWVVEACRRITDNVLVATDSKKVASVVRGCGVEAVLTPSELPSGTDRIWEAVKNLDVNYIVNVQGDEPFVKPEHVLPIVEALKSGEEYATVATPFKSLEEVQNPNNVKVIRDKNGHAIYFSRSVIPFVRDGELPPSNYLKHIGIYGYTKEALRRFVSWPEGFLERAEKLEQLRILENGYKIHVSVVESSLVGIDTYEDLKKAEKILKGER
jgi:3-deoxy-manno-octulosonate cytidylyltransferase (CMP-KDO synthetase)